MNLDSNQHETYITAADDKTESVQEAIPPAAQPDVVIPGPADHRSGGGNRDEGAPRRGTLYGMSLARLGLRSLGAAFAAAGLWFIAAWVWHGTIPLGLRGSGNIGIGSPARPLVPPLWLLAIIGVLVLISLGMMLLGTQDDSGRIERTKKE